MRWKNYAGSTWPASSASARSPAPWLRTQLARHGNPYPRGDLRYAPTFDEMVQDVGAVTPEQLRGFQRRFYGAASAEFSAVGDLDPATVRQALDAAFGDWRQPAAGALPFVRVPRPLVAVAPARFVERTPDKANANLRGELALPLSDRSADFPALMLANYLFGQGDNSRLFNRIRQREGLSYGVYSVIDWSPIDANSTWQLAAIFAPQNQAKVEAALRDELARSLKDGFSAAELQEGRAGLLNARRLARAQDDGVADRLASNLYLDRRFTDAQRIDDALSGLTLDQVNAAWREYIAPDRLVLGWGGDFKP